MSTLQNYIGEVYFKITSNEEVKTQLRISILVIVCPGDRYSYVCNLFQAQTYSQSSLTKKKLKL